MQGRTSGSSIPAPYKARGFCIALLIVFLSVFVFTADRASAATAAGTVIYNTSTATYSDANSNTLNANSNTITATVQNAPALTSTPAANQNVTPGMYVVDTFTLTNTGNASGAFALPSDATFAGTATGTTLLGYVLAGASTGTCSVATPCTSSTLNAQSGMTGIAATTGTVTVGVEYSVSGSAANNQTIITTLTATVTYAAVTGAAAETSASTTAGTAPTDTVKTDARLDVQASGSTPGSSGANITWTVTANNGGGYAAQGLASAKTLFGASNNGVVIFMQTPSYNSTYLTLQATPSAPTIAGASGSTGVWYYNAAACSTHPVSGWSTTYSASAECLAVYVSNTTASVLPSLTSGSSGAGSVSTAQITASFTTNQPSGNGSGNTNSVTLVASSAIGGNSWVTGAVPILGQGLAVGASTDAATASLLNAIQTNTTPSSGTTPPGGASNQAGSQAFASFSLVNGPYGVAAATGWYPGATGTPAADNMHDYTVYNVPCTSNSSAGVNGLSCSVSSTGVIVINEVDNTGPASDSIKLTATAPTGYQVQLFAASGCSGGGSTWPTCTQGSSITSQSTSGGSVNGTVTVASGAAYYYEAVYNAAGNSATPFTAYTTQITAAGQAGVGTGSDTNDTYNVVYPGGVIQIANTVSVTSTNCPAGESPSNALACPGGTLSYGVGYANEVPAAVDANKGTEPAFAYNACYTSAGSLVITDDGAASPSGATAANNWATYTNGIAAAATDTTTGTVFTYYPSASTTYSASQTKLTAQVGGASHQVKPGDTGTITFTAIVK